MIIRCISEVLAKTVKIWSWKLFAQVSVIAGRPGGGGLVRTRTAPTADQPLRTWSTAAVLP